MKLDTQKIMISKPSIKIYKNNLPVRQQVPEYFRLFLYEKRAFLICCFLSVEYDQLDCSLSISFKVLM